MPPVISRELKDKIIIANGLEYQPRTSPCEAHCPAGNPIQKMHQLIPENRLEEALEYLMCRNPFAGITGRICPHPCEESCNRNHHDEGISIRALERFVSDHAKRAKVRRPIKNEPTGKSIAVIGSGPAGMSCAYFSALLGHAVTVFESSPHIGGIPRTAVPDFRLPKDVVDREIGLILETGVRVHTNTTVGKDIGLQQILTKYDACLIAVGAWKERRLDVPGGDLSSPGVSFLKGVGLGRRDVPGEEVVIVGGGGVAFDCAFTAKRLGAGSVHIVCVEDRDHMCAPPDEIRQAESEGIVIHNSSMISRIVHQGDGVTGVEFFEISSFKFDQKGKLSVESYLDEKEMLKADSVIAAIGLQPELGFLEQAFHFEVAPKGTLEVDPVTMATTVDGVFAAGDVVSGPSTVAAAVSSGRYAAMAVDRYLSGQKTIEPARIRIDEKGSIDVGGYPNGVTPHFVAFEEIWNLPYHEKKARQKTAGLPVSEPVLSFEEMNRGFAEEEAGIEAERCFHCGHCISCGICVDDCPGLILSMTDDGPEVAYPDECWHCGCCRIGCPTGAISYKFPLNMML